MISWTFIEEIVASILVEFVSGRAYMVSIVFSLGLSH